MSVNIILHEHKYGAYLYHDSNNNNWIRSGKVTGRGFTLCYNEHEKLAHCKRASSKFYIRYPTKTSVRKIGSSRMGYFDNLKIFFAIGFDFRDEIMNEQIINNIDNEGIFFFNEFENSKINSLNMRDRPTVVLKQIDLIVHLIELAYHISLSLLDNIPYDPGFKSGLGVF